MTAPSNANTSGLEVVAWRWKGFDGYFVVNPNQPKPFEAEPLVTAASAQAEREQYGRWLVTMANDRDAEKARADRLAKALEEIRDLGSDGEHSGDRHARCRSIARAALQQETQP